MMTAVTAAGEVQTVALGYCLSKYIKPGTVLFLVGDLGAGKTTLVKGLLLGMGHTGSVTSPTYTLVEPYEFTDKTLFHFDLYRVKSPEELEMIGIRDMMHQHSVCIFEWPDRAAGLLPEPHGRIELRYCGAGRQIELHGKLFQSVQADIQKTIEDLGTKPSFSGVNLDQ